jgi:hypothetical protein
LDDSDDDSDAHGACDAGRPGDADSDSDDVSMPGLASTAAAAVPAAPIMSRADRVKEEEVEKAKKEGQGSKEGAALTRNCDFLLIVLEKRSWSKCFHDFDKHPLRVFPSIWFRFS